MLPYNELYWKRNSFECTLLFSHSGQKESLESVHTHACAHIHTQMQQQGLSVCMLNNTLTVKYQA